MKTTLRQMTPLQYFEFHKIVTQDESISRCDYCNRTGWVYFKKVEKVEDIVSCHVCGDDKALVEEKAIYKSIFAREKEILTIHNGQK